MRASQRARGEDVALVDALLSADERRRSSSVRFDELRAEQKSLGKLIPKASGDEKAELLKKAGELSAAVKAADAEQHEADDETQRLLLQLGNLVHPDVPVGGEEDFVVLETLGTTARLRAPRASSPRTTWSSASCSAPSTSSAAPRSPARASTTSPASARCWSSRSSTRRSRRPPRPASRPMLTPALVRPRAMEGTGFLGQAAENVYHLEKDDYYLVGTSEVPLAAYHMDEILDAAKLPLRYAGFSPCFRREAGTYGKDTRGIFRVHQFDKVEMFSYVAPEDARGRAPAAAGRGRSSG